MTEIELSIYIKKIINFIDNMSFGSSFELKKICKPDNKELFLEIFFSFSGWQFFYNSETDMIGRYDKETIDFIVTQKR